MKNFVLTLIAALLCVVLGTQLLAGPRFIPDGNRVVVIGFWIATAGMMLAMLSLLYLIPKANRTRTHFPEGVRRSRRPGYRYAVQPLDEAFPWTPAYGHDS